MYNIIICVGANFFHQKLSIECIILLYVSVPIFIHQKLSIGNYHILTLKFKLTWNKMHINYRHSQDRDAESYVNGCEPIMFLTIFSFMLRHLNVLFILLV